jgi:N-acyl homoserine lactone hydrolase
VNTPSLISSCGESLVISPVCGSSVCQHVASQSITRRSRAATSPKYRSRGNARRPSSATSSISRSTTQRPACAPIVHALGGKVWSPLRMQVHALTTGTVRVKHAFLFPSVGRRRQPDLFLPGPWSDPLPIHCWAIEHDGRLLLVDTGETAAARNIPFARFEVTCEQELPAAFVAADLSLDDVTEVVLTHHHGDHVDGLIHISARTRINDAELRFVATAFPRITRRVLRQPLPSGFAPEPFALDSGPFGAFDRSRALSEDGRIVAVDTPGHTPGHISVICIDDAGHHVMLAGDATDTLEQLHARRADAIAPDPKAHAKTLNTILAHCALHPTVYLPSHDPESAARLAGAVTVG